MRVVLVTASEKARISGGAHLEQYPGSELRVCVHLALTWLPLDPGQHLILLKYSLETAWASSRAQVSPGAPRHHDKQGQTLTFYPQ